MPSLPSGTPEVSSPPSGNQPRHARPARAISISAFSSSGRAKKVRAAPSRSVEPGRVDPVTDHHEEPDVPAGPVEFGRDGVDRSASAHQRSDVDHGHTLHGSFLVVG